MTMDPKTHPLDWWTYGSYKEVMRQTGWNLAKARREVRKASRAHGWTPIGHKGYEELWKQIMNGLTMDHDLR